MGLNLNFNPLLNALRKHLAQILNERYPQRQEIVERLGSVIHTQKDFEEFGKLIVDLYELGYLKAVKDYQAELDRLGYNVKIVPPQSLDKGSQIFK